MIRALLFCGLLAACSTHETAKSTVATAIRADDTLAHDESAGLDLSAHRERRTGPTSSRRRFRHHQVDRHADGTTSTIDDEETEGAEAAGTVTVDDAAAHADAQAHDDARRRLDATTAAKVETDKTTTAPQLGLFFWLRAAAVVVLAAGFVWALFIKRAPIVAAVRRIFQRRGGEAAERGATDGER